VFIRARESETNKDEAEPRVILHTFATSDQRTRLQYFKQFEIPAKADECSIKSTIYFTEFSFGLIPAAKATRKISTQTRTSFALADLDKFAAEQHLDGAALDNMTEILDAIIDGKVAAQQ